MIHRPSAPPSALARSRARCCAAATLAALFALSGSALHAQPAASSPPSPSPPSYTREAGDDWRAYASVDELRAAGRFWWTRGGEDVYRHVRLVPDPTFGTVARAVFAASPQPGYAPRMTARLPRPLARMWFRWRMRYSPGFTTAGPNPPGHANSYKVAFWLWEGFEGRGQVEVSNTDQYVLGFSARRDGAWMRYRKTHLPGHAEWGRVAGEWTDGEWWELVAFYDRRGGEVARQHWWKRRLTRGGRVAPGPWAYSGIELSGAPVPRVRAVTLGANRNKSTPREMHVDWGPWEVVDGERHPNPFGLMPP